MSQTVRGGGCYDGPGDCQSAYRDGSKPDHHDYDLGFRIARRREQHKIVRGSTYRLDRIFRVFMRCSPRARNRPSVRDDAYGFRIARRIL